MTFTYSLSTNVGKVRLNIGDTTNTPTAAIFTDEEIQSILDQSDSDVNFASGRALMIIANSKARLAKAKSAGKYSEDTKNVAAELRAQAKGWFEMANVPWDNVAEQTFGDPSAPYDGSQEQDFINREDLRDGV